MAAEHHTASQCRPEKQLCGAQLTTEVNPQKSVFESCQMTWTKKSVQVWTDQTGDSLCGSPWVSPDRTRCEKCALYITAGEHGTQKAQRR